MAVGNAFNSVCSRGVAYQARFSMVSLGAEVRTFFFFPFLMPKLLFNTLKTPQSAAELKFLQSKVPVDLYLKDFAGNESPNSHAPCNIFAFIVKSLKRSLFFMGRRELLGEHQGNYCT